MSEPPAIPYAYQNEGGALRLDAPTYVKRKADDELFASLADGKFCYVLNSRQMGKSSLKVRTVQRLKAAGVVCTAVDLQGIGTSVTEEQWYVSLINRMLRSLQLRRQFDLNRWWTEHHLLSYVQRLSLFLETVLLSAFTQPIVILIDEVDLILSLPFSSDDFFGLLRECYNRRADESDFRRLTFGLFGVATPADLIQNKQITPFNIGQPIDLTGFQLAEAEPLLSGLATKTSQPQVLLQAVLDWTGGQPFLTQKVCQLVLVADSAPTAGQEAAWVARLVSDNVIENWEAQDTPPHLITIRDRLLHSEERSGRLLGLYQQILQHGEIVANDSPEQLELRLTGLVVKRQGTLRIYNRIYEQVFGQDWLKQSLSQLRPYSAAILAWLANNCRDESRLLRGQSLQDARIWAEGKSLGDDDRRFLDASQEIEKRDIQKRLESEAEAKQILATANHQATRLINRGKVALAIMAPIALILGGFSLWSLNQTSSAKSDLEDTKRQNEELSGKNQDLTQQIDNAENNLEVAQEKEKAAIAEEDKARKNLLLAEKRVLESSERLENLEGQIGVTSRENEKVRRDLGATKDELLTAKGQLVTAQENRERAEKLSQIEQKGIALLQQSPEQFSALELLVSSVEAGQELAALSKDSNYQTDLRIANQFSSSNVVTALRVSVNTIIEQNRVKVPSEYYPSAEYSLDKKFVRIGNSLFDSPGKHLSSSTIVDSSFLSSDDASCQRSDEAFGKESERPYEVCWNGDGTLKREQYFNDSYFNRLYDANSGQLLAQLVGLGGTFSPDSRTFISGNTPYTGGTRNYHFYNLTNIKRIANIRGSYADFISNSEYLTTSPGILRYTQPARLYEKSGNFLFQLEGVHPQFSPSKRHLVTHSSNLDDNLIYLYDLTDLKNGPIHIEGGWYPRFSTDGQYLITTDNSDSYQNNVRLYSLIDFDASNFRILDGSYNPRFSYDSKYLLITVQNGEDYFERLYNLAGGNYLDIDTSQLNFSEFSGNSLITYLADKNLLSIYDLRSLDTPPVVVSLEEDIDLGPISNDGSLFLSNTRGDISRNKHIGLFSMSGRKLAELYGNFAEFSAGSQYIIVSAFDEVTGNPDNGVSKLYDRSGHLIREFSGSYATFDGDGNRLLVSSASETRIYDVSGRLLAVYPGNHPSLSPDEKYLVTFFPDGTGRMWQVDNGLEDLLKRGCDWLDAYLNNNPDILDRLWVCQTEAKRKISAETLAIQFGIWGETSLATKADKERLVQQFRIVSGWNPTLPAKTWSQFCWYGTLNGSSAEVLEACEKAVTLENSNSGSLIGWYQDSRGLARALTGNISGAVEDFQAYLQWVDQTGQATSSYDYKVQRQHWINELQAGTPPSAIFTEEVLNQLRSQ